MDALPETSLPGEPYEAQLAEAQRGKDSREARPPGQLQSFIQWAEPWGKVWEGGAGPGQKLCAWSVDGEGEVEGGG